MHNSMLNIQFYNTLFIITQVIIQYYWRRFMQSVNFQDIEKNLVKRT